MRDLTDDEQELMNGILNKENEFLHMEKLSASRIKEIKETIIRLIEQKIK
tara:strand:+ start:274 stop:423 length:150 start_codon:yes stop_codon:yes gene_type:complete